MVLYQGRITRFHPAAISLVAVAHVVAIQHMADVGNARVSQAFQMVQGERNPCQLSPLAKGTPGTSVTDDSNVIGRPTPSGLPPHPSGRAARQQSPHLRGHLQRRSLKPRNYARVRYTAGRDNPVMPRRPPRHQAPQRKTGCSACARRPIEQHTDGVCPLPLQALRQRVGRVIQFRSDGANPMPHLFGNARVGTRAVQNTDTAMVLVSARRAISLNVTLPLARAIFRYPFLQSTMT